MRSFDGNCVHCGYQILEDTRNTLMAIEVLHSKINAKRVGHEAGIYSDGPER